MRKSPPRNRASQHQLLEWSPIQYHIIRGTCAMQCGQVVLGSNISTNTIANLESSNQPDSRGEEDPRTRAFAPSRKGPRRATGLAVQITASHSIFCWQLATKRARGRDLGKQCQATRAQISIPTRDVLGIGGLQVVTFYKPEPHLGAALRSQIHARHSLGTRVLQRAVAGIPQKRSVGPGR